MRYNRLILNGPKILLLFILLIPVFIIDGIISIIAIIVLWPFDKLRSVLETALTRLINTINTNDKNKRLSGGNGQ
mgnify:CR=1 FL=1